MEGAVFDKSELKPVGDVKVFLVSRTLRPLGPQCFSDSEGKFKLNASGYPDAYVAFQKTGYQGFAIKELKDRNIYIEPVVIQIGEVEKEINIGSRSSINAKNILIAGIFIAGTLSIINMFINGDAKK